MHSVNRLSLGAALYPHAMKLTRLARTLTEPVILPKITWEAIVGTVKI